MLMKFRLQKILHNNYIYLCDTSLGFAPSTSLNSDLIRLLDWSTTFLHFSLSEMESTYTSSASFYRCFYLDTYLLHFSLSKMKTKMQNILRNFIYIRESHLLEFWYHYLLPFRPLVFSASFPHLSQCNAENFICSNDNEKVFERVKEKRILERKRDKWLEQIIRHKKFMVAPLRG